MNKDSKYTEIVGSINILSEVFSRFIDKLSEEETNQPLGIDPLAPPGHLKPLIPKETNQPQEETQEETNQPTETEFPNTHTSLGMFQPKIEGTFVPEYTKHLDKFINTLSQKLRAGHKEYGDESFGRRPTEITQELSEEALDVCGWGFILWVRLQELEQKLEAKDYNPTPTLERYK